MPCNSRRLHGENQLRFSNSKHCRFYWTMLKTMRLGVLSWGHLRKNHELRPAWESKSNCWSFRYVYCLTSQRASKVRKRLSLSVSKLATVLIWNIQSPHEDNLLPMEGYKIITSKALGTMHAQHTGTIDLRQLSFRYRALSCGAD